MRTFGHPHNFKGLFEGYDLVLGYRLELRLGLGFSVRVRVGVKHLVVMVKVWVRG